MTACRACWFSTLLCRRWKSSRCRDSVARRALRAACGGASCGCASAAHGHPAPHPGKRPAHLSRVAAPQRSDRTVRRSVGLASRPSPCPYWLRRQERQWTALPSPSSLPRTCRPRRSRQRRRGRKRSSSGNETGSDV